MAKDRPTPPVPLSRTVRITLLVIFVVHVLMGLAFIRSAAPTYDEPVHLASGYSYWKTGRFRLNIMDHPPLAEMWGALPLNFMRPSMLAGHRDWKGGRLYHFADAFVFKNIVSGERMINAGRIFIYLTLSALLLFALVDWGRRLGGPSAAVAAAAAAAFCPVLTSNIALVSTDGVSAVLFFLLFWILAKEKRGRFRWAAAGVVAGLALSAKFNMIVIFPAVAAMLLVDYGLRSRAGQRTPFYWEGLGLGLGCAAVVLCAVYRFTQVHLYWAGLINTLERLGQGRSAFLHGAHTITGFWLYFPTALAIKTPLPILAAAGGGVYRNIKDLSREGLWVILPLLGYFAVAMTSKVQIGVRHLLPMMPFLVLAAGVVAGRLWDAGGRARILAGAGALWMALSVLRVAPYQLAYFNELVGGPANGYRWLVDSNLDWGQDLKALAAEVRRRGNPPIYLAYFGSADPSAYGLRYVNAGMCCNVTRTGDDVDPAAGGKVLFAVSATNLQAVYFRDKDAFKWLAGRRPVAVPGHSIFLYDLTDDREGRIALARHLGLFPGRPGRTKSLLLQ